MICLALVCVTVHVAGCGEKPMAITQYPEFYTEDLKTIAVVPFRSEASDRRAGGRITERFTRDLQQNGTYNVFSHNDLQAMMDQQDLEIFAGTGDASAAAASFRPGGKVQALLVGTVTMYEATRDVQTHYEPVYGTDRHGNRVQTGTRSRNITRIEAVVSISAALIRVSDGTQIHAATETGRASENSENPRRDQLGCLEAATEQAVGRLVEQFGVVRKDVRPGKNAIRFARSGMGGTRNFADRFSSNDATALLVVTLPESCDRNAFRWLICRTKGDVELDSDDFVWDRGSSRGGMTWEICPAQLAADGGGPGSYTAQLISGHDVVMSRKFTIDKPKGEGGQPARTEKPKRNRDGGR